MRHYLEATVMWLENEISLQILAKQNPHDKYRTLATTSVVTGVETLMSSQNK